MVTLTRIYTRTGDGGRTALASGERRPKYDRRIEAYGTVDETNATIGLARLHTEGSQEADAMLGRIQNDLFDLGADLATPESGTRSGPLRSFILPGGTAAAAHLHLARTVCRRAERLVVALVDDPAETVTPAAVKYLNRLSDHLFVLSRHLNGDGRDDMLWVPGANR